MYSSDKISIYIYIATKCPCLVGSTFNIHVVENAISVDTISPLSNLYTKFTWYITPSLFQIKFNLDNLEDFSYLKVMIISLPDCRSYSWKWDFNYVLIPESKSKNYITLVIYRKQAFMFCFPNSSLIINIFKLIN